MLRAEGARPAAAARTSTLPGLQLARSLSGYAWSVIGVTVLGFFFRVFLVGTPPLWRDEAFSAIAARRSWLDMLDVVRHDSAPPLGFLVVKLANTISSTPGSLRMGSVLAGTAMVPVAAALGRRMGGNRAAILAGVTMAVIPAYVAQARDLRMYALASALVLASCLALWRAVERPSPARLAIYAASVALAVYSQYFAVLAIAGQLLAVVVVLRPPFRVLLKVGASAALGGATLVPWLIAAIPQFQHAGAPFWVQPVGISRVEDLWQEFVAGDTLRSQYPHAFEINVLRLLACGGAAVGGLGWIAVAWRSHGDARRRLLFPVAAGLVAVGILLLVSLGRPLYDTRYAAVLEAPMVVAIGVGLAWLWGERRPIGAVLAGLALTLVAVHALALGPNPPNDEIRPLLTPLAGQVQSGDFLALDGPGQYYTVLYYTDAAAQARTHVIAPGGVNWFDGTSQYRPDTWLTAVPPEVTGRVYALTGSGSTNLPMPSGYSLHGSQCSGAFCLQTWSR